MQNRKISFAVITKVHNILNMDTLQRTIQGFRLSNTMLTRVGITSFMQDSGQFILQWRQCFLDLSFDTRIDNNSLVLELHLMNSAWLGGRNNYIWVTVIIIDGCILGYIL